MPELPVKEVRLSELHLPEIDRDEIVRVLAEVRPPTIELPDLQVAALNVRERLSAIDWGRIDPSAIDIGRAVAGVAAVARAGRPILRSRWALAAGTLVVIGLAGAALLSRNAAVRERAGRTVDGVRARIEARGGGPTALEAGTDVSEAAIASDLEPETLVTTVEADAADAPAETASPA